MAAPVTVACHFPLGYFFLHVPLSGSRLSSSRFPAFPRTCVRMHHEERIIPHHRSPYSERSAGIAGSSVQRLARSFSITHTGSPPLILPLPITRGQSSVIHAISIHPARSTRAPRNLEKLDTYVALITNTQVVAFYSKLLQFFIANFESVKITNPLSLALSLNLFFFKLQIQIITEK